MGRSLFFQRIISLVGRTVIFIQNKFIMVKSNIVTTLDVLCVDIYKDWPQYSFKFLHARGVGHDSIFLLCVRLKS